MALDQLALTSRLTAAARARESQRSDRLFEDPYAAELAGPEGFAWLESFETSSERGRSQHIALRTRFFDDFLLRSVREIGIRQVVLVAAGMDSRAFRLDWPVGTRLYEVDRPELLEVKDGILDSIGARATCERIAIGSDLGHTSWADTLREHGYRTEKPSAWLLEGLLIYLDAATVASLLKVVSSVTMPGSSLGTDLPGEDLLNHSMMRPALESFAELGIPWRFGTNEPERLLREHGWHSQATQMGEEEANYGRWPYPVLPRRVPKVPRTFFMTAARCK